MTDQGGRDSCTLLKDYGDRLILYFLGVGSCALVLFHCFFFTSVQLSPSKSVACVSVRCLPELSSSPPLLK